jgi:TonB family protein
MREPAASINDTVMVARTGGAWPARARRLLFPRICAGLRMFRSFLQAGFVAAVSMTFGSAGALADDHPPKVDISRPTPVVYPTASQARGEEGTVVLGVSVTDAGRPRRIRLLKSSGYSDLDNAAMETAFNWHYLPAVHGGETADDWATVQIKYTLPASATSVSK